MKIYYDFHIHTALSPCGSEDMSPNNIINMAMLKGLDVIAITDHNSIRNCLPCLEIGKNTDIIVIPGVEVQTKEEVHVLCLFRDIEDLNSFQNIFGKYMGALKNNPNFFGNQIVFDNNSNVISEEECLLMSSVNITIEDVFLLVDKYDGVAIPAHIDKKNFSIISNLGFIPPHINITTVEISRGCDVEKFFYNNSYINKYKYIQNSDAHYLGDIMERVNYIDVNSKDINAILDFLKY